MNLNLVRSAVERQNCIVNGVSKAITALWLGVWAAGRKLNGKRYRTQPLAITKPLKHGTGGRSMRLIDYFGLTLTFEAIFLLGYRLGRKDGEKEG